MSDIVQIAQKYRERLRGELARVDEFLRMGEELSKIFQAESRRALPAETVKASAPELPVAEPAPAARPTEIAATERKNPTQESREPNARGLGLSFRNAFAASAPDPEKSVA